MYAGVYDMCICAVCVCVCVCVCKAGLAVYCASDNAIYNFGRTCTMIAIIVVYMYFNFHKISAMKTSGKTGIRWHPLFIRWALNIMLCSPKTYDVIRDSGIIILPSKRTLKDYTHWFKSDVGYQNEVFQQLYEDFKVSELNEAQRFAR